MKKIIKILLFAILFYSTNLNAQNSGALDKYMTAGVSLNSLGNLPNANKGMGLEYNIGLNKYFSGIFLGFGVGASFTSQKFDAEFTTDKGFHQSPINYDNLSIIVPLSVGKSFIYNENGNEVDFYGGLSAKFKVISHLLGNYKSNNNENYSKSDMMQNALEKGTDAKRFSNIFNIGTHIGVRYWFAKHWFAQLEGRYDLLNNLSSEDLVIKQKDVIYSPQNFSSRNMSLSLSLGYSF